MESSRLFTRGMDGRVRQAIAAVPVSAPAREDNEHALVMRLVARATEALKRLDACGTGRVLVFEPPSADFGHLLRYSGFGGDVVALVRKVSPHIGRLQSGYDLIVLNDWYDKLSAAYSQPPAHNGRYDTPAYGGQFQVVVAVDVLRQVPWERYAGLLAWLGSLLAPRGYLIALEPSPPLDLPALEAPLSDAGLVLAADPEDVNDVWWRSQAVFQNRAIAESRLVGVLRRITRSDVESDPIIQHGLANAYREAFAGDDWREWVRCTRPGCGRHYSRAEFEALGEPATCLCGWPEPLQPFHPEAAVLDKLHRELADDELSRCYVRFDASGALAGFAWGFVTALDSAVAALVPTSLPHEQERLRTVLDTWLAEITATRGPARTFVYSELGILPSVRSLSLARAMVLRAVQFAADSGAGTVVCRTSRRSRAFSLLTGIGLRVLHRYDLPPDNIYDPNDTYDCNCNHITDATSAEMLERVVLGGNVQEIIAVLSRESDRQVAVRIAHHLKHERGHGGTM